MKNLWKLNRYLLAHKKQLLIGVLLVIGSNFFTVLSRDYMGQAIDEISASNEQRIYNCLLIVACILIGGLFQYGTRQTIIVTSRQIEYELKNNIYAHFQKMSLNFYKNYSTGDLMNRITEDVSHVRMYLGPGIMYPINLISLSVIIITMMLGISAKLTLYTLLPLPFLSFLIYKVAITIHRQSMDLQQQQSTLSSFVQDVFSGIRVVKSYHMEGLVQKNYEGETEKYRGHAVQLAKTQAYFAPLMILIIGISFVFILYIGGNEYYQKQITAGQLITFYLYLGMLIWPFTSLGWVSMLVKRAEASMQRINEFLDIPSEIKNEVKDQTPIQGAFRFENVSLTYENTGIQALKDLSFEINAGETIAIMGKTGSGKSSIVNLLTRQLDPTSGVIYLDNIPLQNHDLVKLRKEISLVPQEPFLFSDTIKNNILFATDDDRLEKAEEVARMAAVAHNIDEFNDRYETRVGERGVTLSGGQKQRISIARALVNPSKIMIFDDSLSAVDTETEDVILTNLKEQSSDKTTIIITHRISSAKWADKILILEDGMNHGYGSHEELMTSNSYYHQLYEQQMSEF